MWIEAKKTFQGLNRFCCNPDDDKTFSEFFDLLKKNFDLIKEPLKNRVKNLTNRATIAQKNEVTLPNGKTVLINDVMRSSAFLLSDGLNLDEYDALELILTGEIQTRNFHNLPHGLCAIVCYYDAHRYYCLLLKSLLAFHVNHLISTEALEKLRNLTNVILSDKNIFINLIDSFGNFSLEQEFQKLSNPTFNALGDVTHRSTLMLIIKEIELNCYEVICMFVLYSSIDIQHDLLLKLFTVAYEFNPTQSWFTPSQLAVWNSLLLFINPVRLKLQCDSSEDVFKQFNDFLIEDKWKHRCVKATLTFCFGVSVKYARSSLTLNVQQDYNARKMVDEGIENLALEFINAFILKIPNFSTYTFLVDVLDSAVKNFICYFREKVHEMFCLCEDELHNLMEGSKEVTEKTRSNLHFKALLELITLLYESNTPQLKNHAEQFTDTKFEALREFVLNARSVTAPALSVLYLAMLRVLCKNQKSGNLIFNLFK